MLGIDPVLGLVAGAVLSVAVTGVLVFVFLRLARKERKDPPRR